MVDFGDALRYAVAAWAMPEGGRGSTIKADPVEVSDMFHLMY